MTMVFVGVGGFGGYCDGCVILNLLRIDGQLGVVLLRRVAIIGERLGKIKINSGVRQNDFSVTPTSALQRLATTAFVSRFSG